MTTTIVLQQAINGIVLGSLYVLVALGLTLIYGVLVQINFAHADFVTLGAFAAYFFMHLVGANYSGDRRRLRCWRGARLADQCIGLHAVATQRQRVVAADRHYRRFGDDAKLDAGVVRADPLRVRNAIQQRVIRFAGIFVTWQNVIIIAVSAITIALLYAFMKFTFLGKALRAVSQDRETAGLMGINPNQLIMLTFVIASALAGMAGAMLAPVLVLTPFAGTSVIVKAFAIVIIGGFGNVEGTILPGSSSGSSKATPRSISTPA